MKRVMSSEGQVFAVYMFFNPKRHSSGFDSGLVDLFAGLPSLIVKVQSE